MYDSAYNDQFPAGAAAYAAYVDGGVGDQPNYAYIVSAFPKAQHLSIALFASDNADARFSVAGRCIRLGSDRDAHRASGPTGLEGRRPRLESEPGVGRVGQHPTRSVGKRRAIRRFHTHLKEDGLARS